MTDPHLMAQIPVPPAAKRPDGLTLTLSLGRIAVRAEALTREIRMRGGPVTAAELLLVEAIDEHAALKANADTAERVRTDT